METRKFRSLVAMLFICILAYGNSSFAAVTVNPVTNGSCLNVTPSPFTVMTNIVIKETAVNDIPAQMGATFILTAPAGFEFNAGIGFVSYTSGQDITAASIVVTSTTITVTFDAPTSTKLDVLRIRNVRVRALLPNVSGDILRTIAGGTAVMTGNAPGAGVSHGSLTATGLGASISTIASGNWSDPGIWFGGLVPSCTDNVIINNDVTVDFTSSINNLTINNGGNLITDVPVVVGGNFNIPGTGVYTHNNNTDAGTTIFAGTENFSADSKIIINNWSSFIKPLAMDVSGDFGEIVINTSNTWNQDGMFAPARIKNTLTINTGYIIMDDGTGMTTSLTMADVVINGDGRLQVQTGPARNLTLITGSFTDNSTAAGLSAIAYRSIGDISWTANGDVTIGHRFVIAEGQYITDVGSLTVNINGNLTINNGTSFDGAKKIMGPMTMNITGNTTITGTPGNVIFKDYYTGSLNFTSGTTTINSGTNVYFMGSHSTIGAATVLINGDFNVSGSSTTVYGATVAANNYDVSFEITNDVTVTDSKLYTALSTGNVAVNIGRNYTQSGVNSQFYGQRNSTCLADVAVTINGSAFISDGLFSQSQGLGSIELDVVEVLSVQNASFYGMNNSTSGNYGDAYLTCADLNISGSNFYLHKGYITDNRTIPVTVTNDINIEFSNAAQEVLFVARNSTSNAMLNLNVGGNFIVFGSANGLFCSSVSSGNETINIGGDMMIQTGKVRFNSYESYSARGHDVNATVGGSIVMSGGSLGLSNNKGNNTWDINGDYEQTGGYAIYKWNSSGVTNIDVQGNYTLSNGNAIFYSVTGTPTSDPVTLIINGNTSIDNAVVMFDSCLTGTATHKMVLKGASVTYGDNVIFNHAAHLSNRTVFANIIYDRAGVIDLRRNNVVFDIRQTKQIITSGTTVDFSSSPNDLMISSHMSSTSSVHTTLTIDGTLNMGTNMIAARSQTNYFASMDLNSGARLKTGHPNGLYSGTATPSCIYPMIAGNLRMNFFLNSNSIVEYNGVDTQILTGTGVGIATTTDHRYGILDINFAGASDVEFVHIDGDSAQVRTALILTQGELNLDSDHITNGGGNIMHILNGAIVLRITGYVRSETEDGSGAFSWVINSPGSYVIPFGRSSTEYIPFTYQPTSGSSGKTIFATNRVAADNTPYPPTVTHVNNVSGADNSANTVDRFWWMSIPGSATANMVFSYTASEGTGIANPRAQLWEPVSQGWFPPGPTQSNPSTSTTQINGVTGFNNWWTLSSSSSPLPIQLISFDAAPVEYKVKLSWLTASELNNDFFTVERSFDGESFTDIAEIDGAGTSSAVNTYEAYDENPGNGLNYYRLRQTDFDGTQSWSEIKIVEFSKPSFVQIFPNPVNGQIVNVSANNERINQVTIYDIAGKMVMQKNSASFGQNENDVRIELESELVSGIYIVEVTTATGIHRERIIKQ